MLPIRSLVLALLGTGALALAGCQEDNDKAVRDQMKLPPPAEGKGVPVPTQADKPAGDPYLNRGASMPDTYPGMKPGGGGASATPKTEPSKPKQ